MRFAKHLPVDAGIGQSSKPRSTCASLARRRPRAAQLEENLSKTRCAKLLPRLVRTHGPAGRAIALACGSTLGPKLERMREMKERVKAAEAFN